MPRDFTPKVYLQLLESALHAGYTFSTFADFQSGKVSTGKCILIRHDIDATPLKALDFAKVENENGIRSTFYFKTRENLFDKQVMVEISGLSHEIGYHYEDFSNARGDPGKAIRSFEENLALMRTCVPVTTICMDGSILSKWNNLDLWNTFNYHDYGIIGEPYIDLDFTKMLYLTDTGRLWNANKFSRYDKVKTPIKYFYKSSFDILHDINSGNLPDLIMITTHPQRWHESIIPWAIELITQRMKNILKYAIIKINNRANI